MTTDLLRSQMAADNHDLNAAEIKLGRSHLSSTPLQINIDLTGICNVHPPCVFCSGKNVGYNYAPVNVAALDAYAPYLERCERVNDDSFGEPLSHPSLVDIARRFMAQGQSFSFVSNGLLLTRDKARQLAELGPHLGIHVSFNAATAGTFYHLTGKSFDLLVENVRTFGEVFRERNGASPDLILAFIVMRMNRHEVPAFLQLTADLRCRALLAPLHDRPSRPLGHFGYDFVYEREMLPFAELQQVGAEARRIADRLGIQVLLQWDEAADSAIRGFAEPGVDVPCLIPFRFLHLQHHSRKVYACPYHIKPIGDLLDSPVEAIWNGAEAQQMRRSLLGGEVPAFCWNNSRRLSHHRAVTRRADGAAGGERDRHGRKRSVRPARGVASAGRDSRAGALDLGARLLRDRPGRQGDPLHPLPELPAWSRDRSGPRHHLARRRRARDVQSARGRDGTTCGFPCRLPVGRRRRARGSPAPSSPSNPWVPAAVLVSSVFEAVLGRPKMIAGSRDTRELGIVVRRIWME